MKIVKYLVLFVLMASNATSAVAQFIAWRDTAIEYNAYFQAGIAVLILGYFFHEVDLTISARAKKKWTPKPLARPVRVQG